MRADQNVYEIVGIKNGDVIKYKSGTIRQICHNEMLGMHNNINDILRDMDIFSDYKHYAKKIKED